MIGDELLLNFLPQVGKGDAIEGTVARRFWFGSDELGNRAGVGVDALAFKVEA